jgi:hypothetical protein
MPHVEIVRTEEVVVGSFWHKPGEPNEGTPQPPVWHGSWP